MKSARFVFLAISAIVLLLAGAAAARAQSAGAPSGQAEPSAASTPRWVSTDGPIGGLGYDIRYNFKHPRLWYVTDSYAGIHLSTDDGKTWFRTTQGLTVRRTNTDTIPIFSATVDPNDADIVWIGTQESGELYKSTDAGQSWTKKTNGIDNSLGNYLSFRGITVEPGNSNVVYAMAELGSPSFTADHKMRTCYSPDSTKGVVYKSTDGGESWKQIWTGNNLARYCFIDPRNHDVLYVSTGIFDREAADCDASTNSPGGEGILKSTDGGRSWRVLNQKNGLTDLHVGSLYMNPKSPDVLLAAASNPDWSNRFSPMTAGVFRSEDGGENWTRVLTGEMFATVEYCTSNPDIAYAASPAAVHRSEDGGKTWQRFDRGDGTWGPSGVIAGFPIDMQCDPNDTNRVFINNYLGGNFLSTDGGRTWTSASQGYTGAQMGFVAVSPTSSATVFGGSRTGVFRNDNAGMGEWTGLSQVIPVAGVGSIKLNEVGAFAVDPSNADHLLASMADLDGVLRSRDGGKTWAVTLAAAGTKPKFLTFSPADPKRVYFGLVVPGCKPMESPASCDAENLAVWRSDDGGDTWTKLTASAVSGHSIASIATHPTQRDTVYVGVSGRGVWKSSDGGATWTSTSSGLLASGNPLRIAIDPSTPDTMFVTFGSGGIYRTIDGGRSWSNVSTGLDMEASIQDIVFDPATAGVIYAGEMWSGVYRSTDGGTTWSTFNDGLDNRAIRRLAISKDGSRMYAATDGMGVFRIDLKPSSVRRRAVGRN